METSECNFHYEPYRRVPVNSATTQKDFTELNSIGSHSTYSYWSKSIIQKPTTTYIDGSTMPGEFEHSTKNLFPKGKGRQKPSHSLERKDVRSAYMSLLPADTTVMRSEKPHSPLPEVTNKSANIRNKRLSRTMIFDNDTQSKFYARCATTNASGAWVRRYKAINESQILSDFLRDQSYQNRILSKKYSYPQLLSSSSSLNRCRRKKYE